MTEGSVEVETGALKWIKIAGSEPDSIPTLFLSGGPGESAIEIAMHPFFVEAFSNCCHGDLIVYDQRGVGRSEPDLHIEPIRWTEEAYASRSAALDCLRDQAARTLARLGRVFDASQFTPWASAADLIPLLDNLRVERVRLWAHSYGTHLATAMIKRYPERIESAVFCGYEGPDDTYKFASQFNTQLRALDLEERVQRAKDRLGTRSEFGWEMAEWMLCSWLGLSNRWQLITRMLTAIEDGDEKAQQDISSRFVQALNKRPATYYLNDAASSCSPRRWAEIESQAQMGPIQNPNFPFPEIGEAWIERPLPDEYREPLRSETPITFLMGGMDCFTPLQNAERAMQSLPKSSIVFRPLLAHNDLILEGANYLKELGGR